MQRNIEGHKREYACPQLTTSKSFALSIMQQEEQRKMKVREKVTEIAKEAYGGVPIYKLTKITLQR